MFKIVKSKYPNGFSVKDDSSLREKLKSTKMKPKEEREKKPKDQTRHISKENLKAAFDALKFPVRTHSCDKAHVFSPN